MGTAYYAAGHIDDQDSLASVIELFEEWHPGYRLGAERHVGESACQRDRGSRVCWIQEGRGEVFLPEGYRTKEGDGEPLPGTYRPEPAQREWVEAVRYAHTRIYSFQGDLRTAIAAVCSRLQRDLYIGDCANDLWSWIEHDGKSPDAAFTAFLRLFEKLYDQVGISVKQGGGWEPVQPGDQIIAGAEPLRVRGDFRYWYMDTPEPVAHISALRRLRYLKDTAGGCNIKFDAFRRMSLTYYPKRGITAQNPDGINQVNSHFVNMPAETSRAHYHPRVPLTGGQAQGEFYFVADPGVYGLATYGRKAGLALWPNVQGANSDFRESVHLDLRPGSVVYITPGTGHRGMDVFANVVTVPGYKLKNQFFIFPSS